jgi:hypothetical protein
MATPLREAIKLDALNIEEKTAISAHAQRDATNLWGYIYYGLGAPTAVLVAVAGLSAVTDNATAAVVFAILATVSASLTNVLNPSAKVAEHKAASCQFRELENRVHIFCDVDFLHPTASDEGLRKTLDGFVKQWNDADVKSPNVTDWLYRKASARVRRNHRFDDLHKDEDESEPRRRWEFWRPASPDDQPLSHSQG